MAEQQSGLRFDIYERVQLPEDTAAVKELDEVELVPHIQVYSEEEQALLKGHLYLTGLYQGVNGEEQRTLEHLIPVEITLPLNRIQDVSQVSVSIDNFDVDILSPRSLNVTGVLTLSGIEMLSLPDSEWEEEEETVFVHEAPRYEVPVLPDSSASSDGPALVYAADEIVQEPAYAWAPFQRTAAEPRAEEPVAHPVAEVNAPAEAEAVGDEAEIYFDPSENVELGEWMQEAQANPEPAGTPATHPAAAEVPVENPHQEEKKEVKVALSGKAPSADSSYHLQSLIHTSPHDYRAQAPAEEISPTPTPRTDALEWKRLFSRDEERRVSRLKVCIVQKEETLEDIASRYGLNPKEIQLYNRLPDTEVAEGKSLLIPV